MTETFHFEQTADGSTTLRPSNGEAMHSSHGAFAETVYIYGNALNQARATLGHEPHVLSVGLGLGYIEALAAASAGAQGSSPTGASYEASSELREHFKDWILGRKVEPAFAACYTDIFTRSAALVSLSPDFVRLTLAQAIADGQWTLQAALDADVKFDRTFDCICFDAYSAKTSPELWNERFLEAFLHKACSSPCVFASYARTGALTRALGAEGFTTNPREGFAGKRESTLATRAAASS